MSTHPPPPLPPHTLQVPQPRRGRAGMGRGFRLLFQGLLWQCLPLGRVGLGQWALGWSRGHAGVAVALLAAGREVLTWRSGSSWQPSPANAASSPAALSCSSFSHLLPQPLNFLLTASGLLLGTGHPAGWASGSR